MMVLGSGKWFTRVFLAVAALHKLTGIFSPLVFRAMSLVGPAAFVPRRLKLLALLGQRGSGATLQAAADQGRHVDLGGRVWVLERPLTVKDKHLTLSNGVLFAPTVPRKDGQKRFKFGILVAVGGSEGRLTLNNCHLVNVGVVALKAHATIRGGSISRVATGSAVDVAGGGRLLAQDVDIRRCQFGIVAAGTGSLVDISRCRITDSGVNGVEVGKGACGILEKTLVQKSASVGVLATGRKADGPSKVTVVDCRIDSTERGSGVLVRKGAQLELGQTTITNTHDSSVMVVGPRSLATAKGGLLHGSLFGHCVSVEGGGAAELTKVRLERPNTCGVQVQDEGSYALVKDCTIHEALESHAVTVVGGAKLVLDSCDCRRAAASGVYACDQGSIVSIMGCTIGDLPEGNGVQALDGALVEVMNTKIERVQRAGVFADGKETVVNVGFAQLVDCAEGKEVSANGGVVKHSKADRGTACKAGAGGAAFEY